MKYPAPGIRGFSGKLIVGTWPSFHGTRNWPFGSLYWNIASAIGLIWLGPVPTVPSSVEKKLLLEIAARHGASVAVARVAPQPGTPSAAFPPAVKSNGTVARPMPIS